MQESVVRKRFRVKGKKVGKKEWWDTECKRAKRQVKKLYRKWKGVLNNRNERKRQKEAEVTLGNGMCMSV